MSDKARELADKHATNEIGAEDISALITAWDSARASPRTVRATRPAEIAWQFPACSGSEKEYRRYQMAPLPSLRETTCARIDSLCPSPLGIFDMLGGFLP